MIFYFLFLFLKISKFSFINFFKNPSNNKLHSFLNVFKTQHLLKHPWKLQLNSNNLQCIAITLHLVFSAWRYFKNTVLCHVWYFPTLIAILDSHLKVKMCRILQTVLRVHENYIFLFIFNSKLAICLGISEGWCECMLIRSLIKQKKK